MHVAGADRPDEQRASTLPHREDDEHRPAVRGEADGLNLGSRWE